MSLTRFATFFLILQLVGLGLSAKAKIVFEKCGTKGFTCKTSKETPNKTDVTFQCNNVTGQDITIHLWNFNSPKNITSFTIQNCETVRLSFTCSNQDKSIQLLKLLNVGNLQILKPVTTHNPPEVYLENVKNIETLPKATFAQIKKISNKPGCFNPANDLNGIFFKNVNIGTIESEAFKNLTNMKNFSWYNVSVERVALNSVQLTFKHGSRGHMNNCKLEVIEPMGFRITGDGWSVSGGRIGNMLTSGMNGTIYDFVFKNNYVGSIQSGAISILAQIVSITDNRFRSIESGAFQRISPGLLHDSRRNFGKLLFTYKFSNNLIDSVEDSGIRPDIVAYKNVAAEVTYSNNTMHCSCEGLTWLGADINLGYGYSVLKDFNMMILDPQNSNTCNFTPCMLFGVRSVNKKNTAAVSKF